MSNVPDINLDVPLKKVETTFRRKSAGQQYDLVYSTKTGRFKLSSRLMRILGIRESNGFDFVQHPEGHILLVRVPDSDSTIYKRRFSNGKAMDKGSEFVNVSLHEAVEKQFGPDPEDESRRKLSLTPIGQKDGHDVYVVRPWDGTTGINPEDMGSDEENEEDDQEDETPEQETTGGLQFEDAPAETPAPEASAEAASEAAPPSSDPWSL